MLTTLFNHFFAGPFPTPLNLQLVHPIFKDKGDPLDCSNYRTISVGPVLAKLYAMVLECRISAWAEGCGARATCQAGFRKERRTTDHIFTLATLIDQARARRRPLYATFVDFRKAFDSVPRDLLWQAIETSGISGRMLAALKNMYASVTAKVATPAGLTPSFPCDVGVKQGCPLSPLLFGLYIDRIEPLIQAADPTAPTLNALRVPLLLYADDLTLLSTTPSGLQSQLDTLHHFCAATHLDVNLTKTEVVIFNPSRQRPQPMQGAACGNDGSSSQVQQHGWHLAGAPITISPSYKYLGIVFDSKSGIKNVLEHLHAAGQRALHALYQRCRELQPTRHPPPFLCRNPPRR